MTTSVQDSMDDISFYIGEEDFHASESVYDSDISETDSESDEFDDGEWLFDDECEKGSPNSRSEHRSAASRRMCQLVIDAPHRDHVDCCACCSVENEYPEKSLDGSMETGLTMACSCETNTAEDVSSQVNEDKEKHTALERIRHRLESEAQKITKYSKEWFQLKEELIEINILIEDCAQEEAKSLVVRSEPCAECSTDSDDIEDFWSCDGHDEPRCLSNQVASRVSPMETLDELLFKPLYFGAFLVVMTHQPSKRNARLCGTHQHSHSQDNMPIM